MAASIRRSPTAPTPNTGSTSPSCRAARRPTTGYLLAAGKIEFNLAANLIQSFDAAAQNIPIVAVASLFQKDPFILMSHPGAGYDRFEDLPKAAAYIGKDAFVSVYQWLKTAYGFRDDKVQPYTFNAAPFIRDRNSIQQGYATSEPFEVARQGGFTPKCVPARRLRLSIPTRP